MVQWLRICLPGDTRVGVCMCEIHVDIWQKPPQYCNYPPNENKIGKKKIHLPMQGTEVRSLVGELRCYKLWGN